MVVVSFRIPFRRCLDFSSYFCLAHSSETFILVGDGVDSKHQSCSPGLNFPSNQRAKDGSLPDSTIGYNLGPFVTLIYLRILPVFYLCQFRPPGQVTAAPVLKAAQAVGVL